jgi:diguanylate cyclase (GGDEF)-like protein/PAS domain S-box-containing protein
MNSENKILAFKECEDLYRLMFQANPHPMWICDLKSLQFLAVNDAAIVHYGYSQAEFLAMTIVDIRPAEDIPKLLENFNNLSADHFHMAGIWRHKKKDGSLIDVEITKHSIMFQGLQAEVVLAHDVTERLRAEKFLQTESQKYLTLLHNASDGIHIVDMHCHLIEASNSFCSMLGYTREEMIGMHVSQWEAKFNVAEIDDLIRDQYIKKGRTQFETLHRRKDGTLLDVEVSGFPLELEGQQVLFNSSRDISERKVMEKAKLAASQYARSLIEASLDPLVTINSNGIITDVNSATEQVTGVNRKKLVGTEFAAYFTDTQKASAGYQQVFIHGYVTDYPLSIRHVTGKVTEVLYNASVYRDIDGKVLGVFAAARDITERKQAELKQRIAATAFESQEAMLITDADNIILQVNKSFTRITGYSSEDVIGESPRIFQSGRHGQDFYYAMWERLNTTGAWEGEVWNKRQNGEIFPEYLTISTVQDSDGIVTHYVATFTDITQKKAAAEEIERLAYYDPLTGIPNRRFLQDRLKPALAASQRNGCHGALLFIDLDNFKTLNDTLGHDMGDLLLKQVAERLESCVRECDTVARLGGDEFVLLLEDLSEQALDAATQAKFIGRKVLDLFKQPFKIVEQEYRSTASIGVTLFCSHKQPIEELLKHADIAMYHAKTAGRNTLRFFDPQMQQIINQRVELESGLHNALFNQQFELYYQLQIDDTNKPLGAEVLIRWIHPEKGIISPLEFIPSAEETGLILPIGQWVLETACSKLNDWQKNPMTRALVLSVNVSARQFIQSNFVEQVINTIQRYGVDPNLLKLELTESMLIENIENTIETMLHLGKAGIKFSLDDFGTGYSSLQYLKKLPLDQLKIDQSFIRDCAVDSGDQAIVCTIIAMAKTLNLRVIAEGVETAEQRQLLLLNGCMNYQGYLFSKPLPIDQFDALLKKIFAR